ncbi:hypothetical protein [Kitasatospora sp. CB02891]|uniref:hypothetical protein n=1 Tax=Kitasatospora sp. CB02891 TaxID=2020329 RepID=UPI000C27001B|nr:hypothetical protein [Kitasatospora sp. CB02891]PJN23981.1 hypothetical protein CG736_18935 [Kitasatospora sp. CB02891]
MSTWHPPAPPGLNTGPLPRRSVLGLWLQFGLQWFWLPFRIVWDFLDNSVAFDGTAEPGVAKFVLTPSRYRLERQGTREEWEAWAGRALDRGIERGLATVRRNQEFNANKYRYKFKGDELVPRTTIRRRYYRGIGLDGLAVLAARRGWQVDWSSGTAEVRVFRPQAG